MLMQVHGKGMPCWFASSWFQLLTLLMSNLSQACHQGSTFQLEQSWNTLDFPPALQLLVGAIDSAYDQQDEVKKAKRKSLLSSFFKWGSQNKVYFCLYICLLAGVRFWLHTTNFLLWSQLHCLLSCSQNPSFWRALSMAKLGSLAPKSGVAMWTLLNKIVSQC